MFTTRSAAPKAPVTNPARHGLGLLVCAHGVYGGPGIAARHVAAIRRLGLFADVRACCLKGQPNPASVVSHMTSAEIFVVPHFMAEGFALRELLPAALAGLSADGRRVHLCRPVGANPRLSGLLSAAALRTCGERHWMPRETTLVVMGHGTLRNPASGATAIGHAGTIARANRFGSVEVAFLDQAPSLPTTLARLTTRQAVVVGFFADRGSHGEKDVPRLLAESPVSAAYAGPIGISSELPDLILDQLPAELALVS